MSMKSLPRPSETRRRPPMGFDITPRLGRRAKTQLGCPIPGRLPVWPGVSYGSMNSSCALYQLLQVTATSRCKRANETQPGVARALKDARHATRAVQCVRSPTSPSDESSSTSPATVRDPAQAFARHRSASGGERGQPGRGGMNIQERSRSRPRSIHCV